MLNESNKLLAPLCIARAVDLTTLVALSSITSEQTKSTSDTEKRITQLLDYLHTHKDATIQYVASDMVYTLGCIIPL